MPHLKELYTTNMLIAISFISFYTKEKGLLKPLFYNSATSKTTRAIKTNKYRTNLQIYFNHVV